MNFEIEEYRRASKIAFNCNLVNDHLLLFTIIYRIVILFAILVKRMYDKSLYVT